MSSSLPPLIRAMLRPKFYDHAVAAPVELRQTHISFVLLTGDYAYKVRKPQNLGVLDLRALDARRHACAEEMRRNTRGAPGLYLDVLPVTQDGDRFTLNGPGTPVEYALRMRQFPQESLFSSLLECQRLSEQDVTAFAAALADYHAGAATDEHTAGFGDPARIRANLERDFAETALYVGSLQTREQLDDTRRWTDGFLAEHEYLLRERVRTGRVRECHGDLHLSNVCRWEGRVILYDCVELHDEFRCADVVSDVAFAAMNLRARARQDLAGTFTHAYAHHGGDADALRLLPLYACRHAYVRAKVRSLASATASLAPATRLAAAESARRYYRLACEYARPSAE